MTATEYAQLVEFLGRRFPDVDRRFTGMDTRITGVPDEVTGLRDELAELRREILGHFDEIYRRLERLEQGYQAITQALRWIEAGLADEHRRREIVERDLAELKRHLAALQAQIEDIEQRLGEQESVCSPAPPGDAGRYLSRGAYRLDNPRGVGAVLGRPGTGAQQARRE